MASFTGNPWTLFIDSLRVVSSNNAWLHFSILTSGIIMTDQWHVVTSCDTFLMTFPAFIHWPGSIFLSIYNIWNIAQYSRVPLTDRAQYMIQSKLLLSILQRNKKYILFRQVPGKIHETWSLKVLLQQNSRIFWYEVSQRLALLHEILTRNINFGQF